MKNCFHLLLNFLLFLLILNILGIKIYAQTFYNQGQVYVLSNAIMHINGNSEVNGLNALLENNGEITVANSSLQGDFKIANSGTVQGDGSYLIEGDWINGATFTSGLSYVNLYGSDQLITGTVQTSFNDLEISGSGIKTQTIDATVTDSLILNDRELATDTNIMYVTNSTTGVITNSQVFGSEGFVSSLGNGALSWDMSSSSIYRFPVGSSLGTRRYREVEIIPASANPNTFTVRFANNNPTLDGYDIGQLDSNLCLVNNLYYHKINHTNGTNDADISIYYESGDGNFDALAQWNTPSSMLWNDMSPINVTSGPYNSFTAMSWNDFTNDPFALALTGPVFANFYSTNSGYFNNLFSFIDSSSGSPYSWQWDFGDGDSSNSQNAQHEYNAGTYNITLIVTSESGCIDTAMMTISIDEGIQIPNVFSPNGDGINDLFMIPTSGLEDYKLSIYNRWGTLLFESVAPEIVWDGHTFSGKEVPDGTYYFILTAVSPNTDYSTTGYLTLLR